MPESTYIAIEGVIGVGKTTLARLMQPAFNAQLLLEVFEENPFLGAFYADRAQYAFQTQIVFLLSRYQQQYRVAPRLLEQGSVISDYTFAKDRLFAHLNLAGDELDTYERLHQLLGENVLTPDLVVYLTADTPALMERIAVRDRTYERNMDVAYIESLARAYEDFFAHYTDAPVLRIATDQLNIVRNPDDLAEVLSRVRAALGQGPRQAELPQFAAEQAAPVAPLRAARRRLADLQRLQGSLDASAGLADAYTQMLRLMEQTGALAGQMAHVWAAQRSLAEVSGNDEEAFQAAARRLRDLVEPRLVDCLAGILRLSNRLGVNLESAYLHSLEH